MKKIASLILAVMLVLAMAVPAMAATVTVDAGITSGHTFEAYQIFTGSQATTEGMLGDVEWGNGIDKDTFLTQLKAHASLGTAFKDCSTAADVAAVLANYQTDSAEAKAFAKLAYENIVADKKISLTQGENTLADGYYLIVDTTNVTNKNDAKNTALLEVTRDITIGDKMDVPEVQKKVKDANDTAGTTTDWQDSADHDINDKVSFQLKATLADNVSSYDTYKIVFHDTMSKGLTYNNDAKVYFNENEVTSNFTITSSTDETTGETTLTITCADVKAFNATDSSVITVEYTATLNENAVLGSAGNPNKVYLEYSNNPNESGSGDTDNTGKTPEDKVIVFTYKVVVNKIDDKSEPLTGAEFTLDKKLANGDWKSIAVVTTNDGTTFTFSGLDDGDYRLTESKTPAGYNTIDPIFFTISADHDIEWTTQGQMEVLNSLTGTSYKTDEAGNVVTGEATFAVDADKASLSTDVVNVAGTQLPETGGMGTTLIYAVGALLVAGAVVVMISKKRAASK